MLLDCETPCYRAFTWLKAAER